MIHHDLQDVDVNIVDFETLTPAVQVTLPQDGTLTLATAGEVEALLALLVNAKHRAVRHHEGGTRYHSLWAALSAETGLDEHRLRNAVQALELEDEPVLE